MRYSPVKCPVNKKVSSRAKRPLAKYLLVKHLSDFMKCTIEVNTNPNFLILPRNMNESTILTSTWPTSNPIMTKNMSLQQQQFKTTSIFTATTVILFFMVIGIVLGNLLVLATTWLDNRLHQPNKYFVACLAVADLLVGVFSIPIRLYMQFYPLELYPIELCRFWIWMNIFGEAASIVTLTVISVDRYFKISKPFKYRVRMNTTVSAIVIVIIWLISAVSATFGLFSFGGSDGVTSVVALGCLNDNKIYYTIVSVVFFFFPSVIIILMYAFIFYIAHQRQKMNRRGELGQSSAASITDKKGKEFRQELKIIRMLALVVCTFILCWGPFFILLLIHLYKVDIISLPPDDWEIVGRLIIFILPSFNSLCNPIIYACFDREYSNAFKHLLKRCILCKFISRQSTQTSSTQMFELQNYPSQTVSVKSNRGK